MSRHWQTRSHGISSYRIYLVIPKHSVFSTKSLTFKTLARQPMMFLLLFHQKYFVLHLNMQGLMYTIGRGQVKLPVRQVDFAIPLLDSLGQVKMPLRLADLPISLFGCLGRVKLLVELADFFKVFSLIMFNQFWKMQKSGKWKFSDISSPDMFLYNSICSSLARLVISYQNKQKC